MSKHKIERNQLEGVLRGYSAHFLEEYSNNKRHVYYSNPLGKYIIVRSKNPKLELELVSDCPCTYDH